MSQLGQKRRSFDVGVESASPPKPDSSSWAALAVSDGPSLRTLLTAPGKFKSRTPLATPLIRRSRNPTISEGTVALYTDRGQICPALGIPDLICRPRLS